MTALPTAECRQCGNPIVFGKTAEGKTIPLDAKAPCYRAHQRFMGTDVDAVRDKDVFVTHFATCPRASHFTKNKDGVSAQDEIDDLRKQLQTAKDRVAFLESRR